MFGREVVANVKWFDKSTCRGLLYFFMFRYEIGSYRKGRGEYMGVCIYSTK